MNDGGCHFTSADKCVFHCTKGKSPGVFCKFSVRNLGINRAC
jgi:hypothetical protein